MTLLDWNDYYFTGVRSIDEQHRNLIERVNQVVSVLIESGDCGDVLFQLLSAHWQQEFALMPSQGANEAQLMHYRRVHERLDHITSLFKQQCLQYAVNKGQLQRLLRHWLAMHIACWHPRSETHATERENLNGATLVSESCLDLLEQVIEQKRLLAEQERRLSGLQHQLDHAQLSAQADLESRTASLKHSKDSAEAISKAQNRFLGIVSHELLTPLNAIQGFAHLLEQSEIPAKQQQQVKRIVRSSEHLHELLDELIQFSRLEAGEIENQKCSFSAGSLVKQIADQTARQALEKNIEVLANIDAAIPRLLGDARLLRQALEILASNAFKFTEHGQIVFSVSMQTSDIPNQFPILFEVRDSGIGISVERQKQLFQAFGQVDTQKIRGHGGIGLGLVICERLIRLMNGELSVQSVLGEGSVFRIRLVLEVANTVRYPSLGKPQQPIGQSLIQLTSLLKQDNLEARRLYYCVQPSLFEIDPDTTNQLTEQVQNYEFDQALLTLNDLVVRYASDLRL
jgi:signal transduction histidine kinase